MPQRRVYFYRAYCGRDEGHRPLPFDTDTAVGILGGLDFAHGDGDAYLIDAEGDRHFCRVDRADLPHRLRITRSRRQHLPPVEQAGELDDLDIAEDAGLAEESFVVCFEGGTVGCIYNGYSPRISVLRRIIQDKCGEAFENLDFAPLVRQDAAEALADMQEIRLLEIHINPEYSDQVEQASGSLARAIRGLQSVGRPQQVAIVLKPEPYGRDWLGRDALDAARRLFGMNAINEGLGKFRVKGLRRSTGGLDDVDLLNEKLVVACEVEWEDARSARLYAPSAYNQIQAAYDEHREDLERASRAV